MPQNNTSSHGSANGTPNQAASRSTPATEKSSLETALAQVEIPLGDMLAGNTDDPSMSASRAVDWEEFLDTHDHRFARIVCDLASGKNTMEMARQSRRSYFTVRQIKARLEADLRDYMGDQAIADSARIPAWRGNILADHERAACRADRRRH